MELESIVEYVKTRDIYDPSCMDQILIYLEKLKTEDEDFMQLLAMKCTQLEIDWEQPWYQQSHIITRPLKDHYENEIDTYRKDTISKEEHEKIEKNWRKFRKRYDMPNTIICFARWRNEQKGLKKNSPVEQARHYLTAYLAKGLERTLFQVYRHVLTHFGCPNKRAYQPYELKIMEIIFQHYPTRAVTFLSKILGREPRGIYKQLAIKFDGKLEKKRAKWTLPRATKYLQLLLQYTGLSVDELLNLKIDKSIWLKMEKDMDQHNVYLQNFWYNYLHVQLFVKSDVKTSRVKRKVFKILRESNYKVWTDIRWKDILKHFPDGFTHKFIYRLCVRIFRSYPKYLTLPLQEIVKYGLKQSKLYRFHNRRLKTVQLNENGELEYVSYEKKEN